MRDDTRRRFVRSLGLAAGSAAVVPAQGQSAPDSAAPSERHSLDGLWAFRLDPDGHGESRGWHQPGAGADWDSVTVPHTWNIEPEQAEYWGAGWYRREIDVPESWRERWLRLEFEAVYHTANVWVNGREAGAHERKGYTAFWVDISPLLRYGEKNTVVVRADNTFRQDMLPRDRSYDWIADGGITRPVTLHVTPKVFVERVRVDAEPDLERHTATVRARVIVRNTGAATARLRVNATVSEEETGQQAARVTSAEIAVEGGGSRTIDLPEASIDGPKLWHFDHPHLYRLDLGAAAHHVSVTFGIRKIEIKDVGFYLNGERLWLTGVERMAGSNPEYGMAEPEKWIVHDHDDMKELNCVFTRVHWQQDRRLLDYCDRHGMMIQLEVPSWGPRTFADLTPELETAIQQNGLEQLREMIARDRNHPCVFSWGLCNEVNGQNPPAQKFIRRMAREARKLDPARPLTYASNSLQRGDIASDASGEMDFIMWNEYYESWMGKDVPAMEANLEAIHAAFPNKPIVISEYGYCECRPQHSGGDPKRIDILHHHNEVFRKHDWVGGTIFFSYNDYRTHIGDKGIGPLKQRVHGEVDLYGHRKPSFEKLRAEASPVEEFDADANGRKISVRLRARRLLPGYTLRGYGLRWILYGYGGLPMEAGEIGLPEMAPGAEESLTIHYQSEVIRRIQLDVMRPTRFSAATTILEL